MGIARIADGQPVERKRRDGRERCCSTAPGSCSPRRATRGWSCATSPSAASAPRGSIYHHFPGGKRQLAREAAELEGTTIRDLIERSLEERGLKETLTMFGEIFRRRVADHPERIGCPVAAAALARPEDPALAAAATAAFQSWERPIAAALRDEGVGAGDAETFAGLVVSTVEGALLRARAAGEPGPARLRHRRPRPGARRAARRGRLSRLPRPTAAPGLEPRPAGISIGHRRLGTGGVRWRRGLDISRR